MASTPSVLGFGRLLAHSLLLYLAGHAVAIPAPTEAATEFTALFPLPKLPCQVPTVRREWRSLQPIQRVQYLEAVKCVMRKPPVTKSDIPSVTNRFEDFLAIHIQKMKQIHYVVSSVHPHLRQHHESHSLTRYYTGHLPPLAPVVSLAIRKGA
jgi:hypothetical protein